jgi:hypothetical protein
MILHQDYSEFQKLAAFCLKAVCICRWGLFMKESTRLLVIIYSMIFLLLGMFTQKAFSFSIPVPSYYSEEREKEILLKYLINDPGTDAPVKEKIKTMYRACDKSLIGTTIMALRWK